MTGCHLVGWNWIQRKQRFCGLDPSSQQLSQISIIDIPLQSTTIRVGVGEFARDLGVIIECADSDNLESIVVAVGTRGGPAALCRIGFYHLRQLRPMLRSLTHEAARTLIQAFISSRLDYCNSLLYGVSENLIRAERRCSASHWSRTTRPYLAGFAAVALAASSEMHWLQTSMFCLLVFVWPRTSRTSVPRRRHTSGLQRSSTAATLFHW